MAQCIESSADRVAYVFRYQAAQHSMAPVRLMRPCRRCARAGGSHVHVWVRDARRPRDEREDPAARRACRWLAGGEQDATGARDPEPDPAYYNDAEEEEQSCPVKLANSLSSPMRLIAASHCTAILGPVTKMDTTPCSSRVPHGLSCRARKCSKTHSAITKLSGAWRPMFAGPTTKYGVRRATRKTHPARAPRVSALRPTRFTGTGVDL